ncbi:MAG: PfaB family protein, partial [bacterium]|nr:PfaB family protein [bacterium]
MEKIAIIGASCLFPGAETLEQFWNNLIGGVASTSEATAEQMGVDPKVFYHPEKGQTDKYYCMRGGFVRGFQFDPTGFTLPADSLKSLDDVFKWSLHVSREALKDSGYLNRSDALSRCGIVLGNLSFPTKRTRRYFGNLYRQALNPALRTLLNNDHFELEALPGDGGVPQNALISGYPASIVAQALCLGEPTFALDAACASSLYAVDLASRYLRLHRADLMLAGAVSCADPLFIHQGFSIFHAYPENGQSRPLDKASEGLIAAEGAGMFVLKRYSDARRDGDHIYAVIQGAGLSNDGKGKSVLNPNPRGQVLAFERAYAEIDPATVDYVECHATGTPVGDPAELDAMATFWPSQQLPRIGSVKSNLGHMLSAAGMASMLKVILGMERGQIPPTIHITDPQQSGNGVFGPDHIVTTPTPWPDRVGVRRAGVSTFGFGGTNAHIILQQDTDSSTPPAQTSAQPEPSPAIAMVGMDAVFGGCKDLEAFGHSVYQGLQHIGPLPSQRWKGIEENEQLLKAFGFENGKAPEGAYIQNLDIDFLNIKTPPGETDQLIPQQLLMLHTADRAVRDAGLEPGGKVGVIVAMSAELAIHAYLGRCDLTWQIRAGLARAGISLSPEQIAELETIAKDSLHNRAQVNQYTSFIGNIMAGRIAALWDFSGPAFTLSAGETAVPRALEIAQMLLADGEVDAMVVGAVDLAGGPEHVLVRNLLSPSNTGKHTLSYDRDVNGWTVGEGAGAVVLKRLDTAQKDQDRIYAAIQALSCTRSASPGEGVLQACQQALDLAGLTPADIGYLEVSGSGMEQEDRAEVDGLTQTYGSHTQNCALGSIKANIGHTFSASGMAGLIKTALCLHHRYLPGVPGWSAPKTFWQNSPFYVPTQSRPWFTDTATPKRTAAINILGIDGDSAHIILSEAPERTQPASTRSLRPPFHLFPIFGQTQRDLLDQLDRLEQTLRTGSDLPDIANRYFQEYEKNAPFALGLVGGAPDDLRPEIRAARDGIVRAFETGKTWASPLGSYFTADPLGKKGKIAFVYPGSANTYVGMGRDIWQLFPRAFDGVSQMSAQIGERMCEHLLYPRSLEALTPDRIKQYETKLAEDAVVMFQTGVGFAALNTRVIRDDFQVQPHIAFGYSLGESSMLFALGVWQDPDIISEAMATSPIFREQLFGPKTVLHEAWNLSSASNNGAFWSTYALRAKVADVTACLKDESRVYLTMINTPEEIIIAGDTAGCERAIRQLECAAFRLPFNGVLHCNAVDVIYDAFVELHTLPVHDVPNIDFYSAVDCAPIRLDTPSLAHNIGKTVSNRVDFPRIVNQVYQDNARIFIDLGPRGTAAAWIDRILRDRPHLAVAVDRKGKGSFTSFVTSLAKLLSHRVPLDLSPLYEPSTVETQKQKSLIKTITLGGARIDKAILSAKNRLKPTPVWQALHKADPSIPPVPTTLPQAGLRQVSIHPALNAVLDETLTQTRASLSRSHAAFLSLRTESLRRQAEMIQLQTDAFAQLANSVSPPSGHPVIWDKADLLEFAQGNIANVFGPAYDIIDTYSRRVRLPTPPYLLVSRITHLHGERGVFKSSAITTEYDIPQNAWYTVDGQIPWAVAVESGQCDLLLVSYLGIDFECKSERIYRLLDCTLTFLDDLPREGETLRYDIRINSFSRSGDSLLFFFSYECFVKDRMVLKMDGGCAGFFSDEELAQGKGVIFTETEQAEKRTLQKQTFDAPLSCPKTAFNREDLLHLTRGDLATCFGKGYDQNDRNRSLKLPPEAMLMVDRLASVDPQGGPRGLGLIIAEKDLAPDHWYFPCHFKDDQVLAGSLIGEACAQVMQFYLLYLGLQTHTEDARFQPIPNLPQVVRCRGQVIPTDTLLTYRMEITKIGLAPKPYAVADVEVILDGKTVVHFKDLGVQLSEKQESSSQPANQITHKPALFNENHIREFATGSIPKCFGPEYQIYETRRAPRTPNGDLQLISRVLEVHGQRGEFSPDSHLIAEYDVPSDPWFYRQNPYPALPYSIAMEIALQPCGFLSAYLGSTLPYPEVDFYFRNLDG